MLTGTAARVLFGEPAFRLPEAFADPPFEVTARALAGGGLGVEARVRNAELKSTFTQTWFSDPSAAGQFNDRALVSCPLPEGTGEVRGVASLRAEAGGRAIPARLVGFGVERDGGARTLHVLVDLPSTGYQDGPIRRAGARVSFEARS